MPSLEAATGRAILPAGFIDQVVPGPASLERARLPASLQFVPRGSYPDGVLTTIRGLIHSYAEHLSDCRW